MPTFIIERNIPSADKLGENDLCAISAKSNEAVAGFGKPYKWITSYVARDKYYCVHEAESAEEIPEHARRGGADKITEVSAIIGPETEKAGKGK